MNKLPLAKRAQILSMLCEGASMRSIERIVGCSINTVDKLLREAGEAALAYHDAKVRSVKATRVQCDEIWSFVTPSEERSESKRAGDRRSAIAGHGRQSTPDTQAADQLPSRRPGHRIRDDADGRSARRLANRVQLTTDGHKAYLGAVEEAFGADVDYAKLVKMYGEGAATPKAPSGTLQPRRLHRDTRKNTITGNPDPDTSARPTRSGRT